MNELRSAKAKLYHLLLQKDHKDLTANEIKLMFLLSSDKEIQELLNKKR